MTKVLFTLDEANALIPFLNAQFERLKATKGEIDHLVEQCQEQQIDLEEIIKAEKLPEGLMQVRQQLENLSDEINDIIFEIQEKGPVVKDIERGLADFYCQLGEETVFLCWQHGEPEIKFWHGTNESFANRKNLMERRFLECVTKLH